MVSAVSPLVKEFSQPPIVVECTENIRAHLGSDPPKDRMPSHQSDLLFYCLSTTTGFIPAAYVEIDFQKSLAQLVEAYTRVRGNHISARRLKLICGEPWGRLRTGHIVHYVIPCRGTIFVLFCYKESLNKIEGPRTSCILTAHDSDIVTVRDLCVGAHPTFAEGLGVTESSRPRSLYRSSLRIRCSALVIISLMSVRR